MNYSKSKEEAELVVQTIKHKGGTSIATQDNMTNPKEISHLFSETEKKFGKLDILIKNAGFYEFAPLEKITNGVHRQKKIHHRGHVQKLN